MVFFELSGTDEPVFDWEYAGSQYRLSIVGGIARYEQQVRGGWYLIDPSHDVTSMMICAQRLADQLQRTQAELARIRVMRTGSEA